jgi:hypothetical protein
LNGDARCEFGVGADPLDHAIGDSRHVGSGERRNSRARGRDLDAIALAHAGSVVAISRDDVIEDGPDFRNGHLGPVWVDRQVGVSVMTAMAPIRLTRSGDPSCSCGKAAAQSDQVRHGGVRLMILASS